MLGGETTVEEQGEISNLHGRHLQSRQLFGEDQGHQPFIT